MASYDRDPDASAERSARLPPSSANVSFTTCSFVVRIWVEETGEEIGRTTWRGHITHVMSGEKRHVERISDVVTFMTGYLAQMGIQPDR